MRNHRLFQEKGSCMVVIYWIMGQPLLERREHKKKAKLRGYIIQVIHIRGGNRGEGNK
jgi:type II secretory pathway component PulM